jgi:hypothetical protein
MPVILKTFAGIGSIVALVLLIVALLKQLVTLVGFIVALLKIGIVLVFVAIVVMIGLAILRDRSRRKREVEEI